MFDDSYFFFKGEEERDIPLPEKVAVSTALEIVRIVATRTSIKLDAIQSDFKGGILVHFSNGMQIQISSKGNIFPSVSCTKYFTLDEFESFAESILKGL